MKHYSGWALAPLAALLCGCATTFTPPEPAIGGALGLGAPLVFRTEGGPVDEPHGPEGTLPLAEAVELAVTTDPSLQGALARVRGALADADQARLLPNPVLNLILKFPEHGGRPGIEAELTGDLVAVLRMPRRISAADHRLRAAAAEAMTTALDVAARVQERYAAVQGLDELVPVLEERWRLHGRLLQLANDRLDAGEGTRGDVTTLRSQGVELGVEIAERERERTDERLRLARLIGRPSSDAAWALESWRSGEKVLRSESAWIETGLAHRPEIQGAEWELAALGDDAAMARSAPFEGAEAGVKADRDDGWSVGPSITTPIPIFDTGQARRAKLTARQIEARHRLTEARRQVVEDVRRAYRSLAAVEANLATVRGELVPLQQKRRDEAEQAYRAGLTDVMPLFLAERDLLATRGLAIEMSRQEAVALVALQRAVGGAAVGAEVEQTPPGAASRIGTGPR